MYKFQSKKTHVPQPEGGFFTIILKTLFVQQSFDHVNYLEV